MKIWSSNHTFSHPWETVVQAASRKYPNPINPNVLGVDVLDRSVDKKTGVLTSRRLLSTSWGFPGWVIKFIGIEETCYVSEYSEVNPKTRTLSLKSRNLTFSKCIDVDETLIYTPDPKDPKNSTILQHEAVITVDGIPMSNYCENMIKNTINSKASMGRQAMEWVINHIKEETDSVRREIFSSSQSFT